jgi:hypothetical protein
MAKDWETSLIYRQAQRFRPAQGAKTATGGPFPPRHEADHCRGF